jgi:FemAB-related protein (PEP-CTERM system-associated)
MSMAEPRGICIHKWDATHTFAWDEVVGRMPHAHLAVASAWQGIINRAYGHRSAFLMAEGTNGSLAVLPAIVVRHWLLGAVVTSMPFLDAGGPCGDSSSLARTLVERLAAEASGVGAGRVELRCATPMDLPVQPSLEKVTLILPLHSDPDRLWRGLEAKVRNQVRKAEKAGLIVEVGGGDLLDAFYEAFAVNMRDLGSPVHAKAFFQAILDRFGQAARVVLVKRDGILLGGLISLAFKDTLYVPWASSLRKYASLCPNMLLYWETLRRGCKDGFANFDFGRSTRGSGTYRFKRQWGASEAQLYWYTISLDGQRYTKVSGNDAKGMLMQRLWSYLPLGVSRVLGPRIRRYLTQ